jgi:PhzF family phenazine biosynthesis protein
MEPGGSVAVDECVHHVDSSAAKVMPVCGLSGCSSEMDDGCLSNCFSHKQRGLSVQENLSGSSMNSLPLFHVDAFASRPFTGNPAAVCLLEEARDSAWMQSVAMEMNLADTAFLLPMNDGLELRWFTPAVEVDLCGHATLAAAHVLKELVQACELPDKFLPFWKNGYLQFRTRSGLLSAESTQDGMTLDFPATGVQVAEIPDMLLESLGVSAGEVRYCGRSKFDILLHVSNAAVVRRLGPDFAALAGISTRGVIVTALGDSCDHDIVSRFFAPAAGINEDPVTGSAHCALAPYWVPQFGRSTLFGFQASSRGGLIRMELRNDRVRLSGKAVTIARGKLLA